VVADLVVLQRPAKMVNELRREKAVVVAKLRMERRQTPMPQQRGLKQPQRRMRTLQMQSREQRKKATSQS